MKNNLNRKKEEVVLVDEKNNILGTFPKIKVHGKETPLHRGFSLFLFNEKGELLLQQRSGKKKTWPLTWSNSCCGHPFINESNIEASKRRLFDELGMQAEKIIEVDNSYRYKYIKDHVMENEICPILVGYTKGIPNINIDEVESIEWIAWEDFLKEIYLANNRFSPWCIDEAKILEKTKIFQSFLKKIEQNEFN